MSHKATISVSMVQAVQESERPPPFYETTRDGKRKRVYERVQPQHYFHTEYQLLPCNAGESTSTNTFKTDVVTYDVVAKVHTAHDQRVVNVWSEQGLCYYGWQHRHTISVDKDLLLRLHDHTLRVRVWNSIDKVSVRTRFDRPKAFRLPVPQKGSTVEADTGGGVSHAVRPEKLPVIHHAKDQVRNKKRMRTRLSSNEDGEVFESNLTTRDSVQHLATLSEDGGGPQAAAEGQKVVDALSLSDPSKLLSSHHMTPHDQLSQSMFSALRGLSRRQLKQLQSEAEEKSRIDREGLAVLEIKMADLFAVNTKTVSAKLGTGVGTLKGFEVTVATDTPLMSEQLKKELNPMTITVCKANSLPPHPPLEEKYEHTFVRYSFPFKSMVETSRLPHHSYITWGDSSTVLLGTIPSDLLLERLRGPPLDIELHDRDVKQLTQAEEEQLLAEFGTKWGDDIIGTCAFGKAHREKVASQSSSPYGVGKLDLGLLLEGQSLVEMSLPIIGEHSAREDGSAPVVDYLENNTTITMTIQLSQPLHFPAISSSPHSRPLCPFGRVVYIVNSDELADLILAAANRTTAAALGLTHLDKDTLTATLSTYKLTRTQMSSDQCNVLTGFHFTDNTHLHIIALEGLHSRGVQQLWEQLPHHSTQDPRVVKVLYNSEYTFSERLYGELDVDLVHVRLQQALTTLVQQPAIYIHRGVPASCLKAITTLHELQLAGGMANMCRRGLFPTADMVFSLSLQCELINTPTSEYHVESTKGTQEESSTAQGRRSRRKTWHPLDNYNETYEKLLQRRRGRRRSLPATDHITLNMMNIKTASEELRSTRVVGDRRPLWAPSGNEAVHNYSTQTYNSVELSKSQLREQLDPSKRYTYCQDLHSMTLEPGDVLTEEKQRLLTSRRMWRTSNGFVHPEFKNARSNNTHPQKPDENRIVELLKPFEDNFLHANKLKPSVSWLKFAWDQRNEDFELYRPPPQQVGPCPPVSIQLTGKTRQKELEWFTEKEKQKWQSRLVVDDPVMHIVRRAIRTELSERASCQADKLQSLLKDTPMKKSLMQPDQLRVDNIPPLSILSGMKQEAHIAGYSPGPHLTHSLRLDSNVIPITRPDHPQPTVTLSKKLAAPDKSLSVNQGLTHAIPKVVVSNDVH